MGEIFERTMPQTPLEWTGERLTTAMAGQVEIEHLHRYFMARSLARDRDVLDIACGEGYGSALMAQVARSVIGVDVSQDAVEHARRAYPGDRLTYRHGDARKIPADDASVDLVVSFETLEHFFEHDEFMREVRRVLRPGGLLLLSSPERDVYSPPGSAANPYHVNELSRAEFDQLLRRHFEKVRLLSQRPMLGSVLVVDEGVGVAGSVTFEKRGPTHFEASPGLPRPPYLLALVTDGELPPAEHSIYIDTDQIQGLTDLPRLQAELGRETAGRLALEEERQRYLAQAQTYERNAQEREAAVQQAIEDERQRCLAQLQVYEQNAQASERQRHDLERRLMAAEIATADGGSGRHELQAHNEALEAEIATLRVQQDLMRRALRRRVATGSDGAAELQRRLLLAEDEAQEWQRRYETLRERLFAVARRLRLDLALRMTPRRLKHYVRARVLGGASQ